MKSVRTRTASGAARKGNSKKCEIVAFTLESQQKKCSCGGYVKKHKHQGPLVCMMCTCNWIPPMTLKKSRSK